MLRAACAFCQEHRSGEICKPELMETSAIELGAPGEFKWLCDHNLPLGEGFYVVFIRPSGTYVLLKVPRGRTSFEFTPDTIGMWRWMVINTHPDKTKPDVESSPGNFQVVIG
ncbi:MAG: hypothetical protein V1897_08185, partial [Pseudomonadota bacterium]